MVFNGGIPRKLDLRDLNRGRVQAPIKIPKEYKTDISWLEPIWQSSTPTCGAHAGAHLKAILDKNDTGTNKYSPRSLWLFIKAIDGYPIEEGTDMRSILKSLQDKGVADYDLLPNNFPITNEEYSDQKALSPEIIDNAKPRIIKAYAFDDTYRSSIKQAIYQNGCVLILLDVGTNWWGAKRLGNIENKIGGHFCVGYGYNDNDDIFIIDSADKTAMLKSLSFVYPIREVGTAIDLPDDVVKKQTQALLITQLQKIVQLYQQLIALTKLLKGRKTPI